MTTTPTPDNVRFAHSVRERYGRPMHECTWGEIADMHHDPALYRRTTMWAKLDMTCLVYCGSTAEHTVMQELDKAIAARRSPAGATDQLQAAMNEVQDCGCAIEFGRNKDGKLNMAFARPVHHHTDEVE